MNFDLPPDWPKGLAGPGGAMLALYWLKGGGWHKLVGFSVGCAASIVGPVWLSAKTGMDYGLCAFLIGMFAFSVIAKVFETIERADLWPIVRGWLKKPPRKT